MSQHTPGPWSIWTSNSWRRIGSYDGHPVCEPIVQNDGHPDLHFRNGGENGPDARLIARAPELLTENERLEAINADLLAALQQLHDNIAEYARINNLGGFDNQDMQQARAAIARAQGNG